MIRLLLCLPFLLLAVLFALSNTQSVRLALWPTDYAIVAPLSLAMLALAGLCLLAGAVLAWAGALPWRRRAHRAESTARALEAQLAALRARNVTGLSSSPALPPPG